MSHILLIDDEEVLTKNVARALERAGHSVTVAATAADGLRSIAARPTDLALLDLRLPDACGLEVLPKLLAADPGLPVLMITAFATVEDAVKAIRLGARDYLQKPLRLDELRNAVALALEERRLRREVAYYRDREARGASMDALLGCCEAIEHLRRKLRRLATLPQGAEVPTVLLQGETGTGKGTVARILHFSGPRAHRPFVQVNAGAIPEGLVEAELFGFQKGAFTDAKASKPGLFRAADGGTLFLDEIGSLPLATQPKLLKAIEEKTIRHLGSVSEESVDVQIVAASNRDLEELVREGRFREDLLYRLQVAPLVIPPLRERGDDVLLLARTFLAEAGVRYRRGSLAFTPAAEAAIAAYAWPGNVRELRNTLDRTVLFADGDEIGAGQLGLPSSGTGAMALQPGERGGGLEIDIPDGGIRFADVERAMIVASLRKARGSKSEAARLLGLSRDTLRYRIEKLDIPRDAAAS